jgi:hypothetical protein
LVNICESASHADRFRDLFVGADSRFPIVNAIAPTADDFSWIEEVGRAEIEIDIADRLANAAAHRDFRSGLRRQFDAGYRNPGVELRERRFDGAATEVTAPVRIRRNSADRKCCSGSIPELHLRIAQ